LALEHLVDEIARRVSKMTLDELVLVLPRLEQVGGTPQLESLDGIARTVLSLPSQRRLRDAEKAVVSHALETCQGNVSAAARLLGIDRKALERKIRRHGISRRR
jgi:two-component system response regulator HydG